MVYAKEIKNIEIVSFPHFLGSCRKLIFENHSAIPRYILEIIVNYYKFCYIKLY